MCALTATGVAYCWGRNNFGQIGDSTRTQRTTPVAVTGGHTFAQIDVSGILGGDSARACCPATPTRPWADTNPHPEPLKVLDPS